MPARYADRRAAGDRAGGHDRDAAADHVQPQSGGGADHARRHLLWRAVRRLDHRDPGQHPRRIIVGGHLPRRLPDGAPGARRAGARRGGARLVLRRLRVDADHRARRAAACRGGAQVRPVGVLLADGVRPGGGDRARARLAHQGDRDGGVRPAARHRRHRRQLGRAALTFNIPELSDGIGFVIVAMGMFGTAEIVANLELKDKREIFTKDVKNLWPTREDFKRAWAPVMRGTALGSFLGILPGGGALLASFGAYTMEKKMSRHPEQFGKGAIEGVAGPESANNAGAQTSFIPMLTLGIPSNAVMALMIGALMIQGIAPGPQVMNEKPQLFWGLIASMWVGNLMLVVLNLPLIGMWVKLLTVPYRYLYPSILVFMAIGVFSLSNNAFDVLIMAVFGVLGYICVKLECEPAPMILGFILGPLMEENLRRAMLLSRGDPMTFIYKPISAGFIIAATILLIVVALPAIRKKREDAFAAEE